MQTWIECKKQYCRALLFVVDRYCLCVAGSVVLRVVHVEQYAVLACMWQGQVRFSCSIMEMNRTFVSASSSGSLSFCRRTAVYMKIQLPLLKLSQLLAYL